MNILYLYGIATLVALLPIYLIKEYVITSNINLLVITILLYALLAFLYIKIFEQKEISSSYTLLQISQILAVTAMGSLFFNEIINFNKITGLIFGILSVYFLA
jgi:drug/metabolite transporter (DMT)-like permease